MLKTEVDLASGDLTEARNSIAQLQALAEQFKNNKQVLAATGALQLRVGNLTLARKNLDLAAAFKPPPALALVQLARLELIEGNASAAQRQLDQLTSAGINSEEIQLLKGDTLRVNGSLDQAVAHFKEMAENGSRTGTSRYSGLLTAQGENEQALAVLEGWLKEHPEDTGFKMLVANLGLQQGDNAAARQQYESMMPTNDPVVLNNLAWIYMQDDDPRAIEVARLAHDAQPDSPDISDTLGWILVNQGSEREALGLLRQSARAKPEDPTIQYHLGVAFHKVGEMDNARDALQRALDLGEFDDRGAAEALLNSL